MVRCCGMLSLFTAVLFAPTMRHATAAEPQTFKVFLDSQVTMEMLGNSSAVDAQTTVVYDWSQQASTRSLAIQSLGMKVNVDGSLVSEISMSREGLVDLSSGQPVETKYDGAPAELQTMLADTFGPPLLEIEVDAQGVETKRTMLAKEGAHSWVDSDIHLSCLIFHPPYVEGHDQWEHDAAVSMGNGVVATGKLTYTRVPDAQVPTVKVTGTLGAKDAKMANGVVVTDATYVADGEMTYDPAVHEWVTGKLHFDCNMTMAVPTGDSGTSKGTMALTFGRPAKTP